jgi:hypothetical protein
VEAIEGKILVKMKFGSHLYGTDDPSSDLDFKGVFQPNLDSLIHEGPVKSINNYAKGKTEKNKSSDIDVEFYSLQHFMKMAVEGQMVAMDMLHAPQDAIVTTSSLWDALVEQRSRFYTKSLNTFVGYARKQAAKYGIKGSRLDDARRVIKYLEKYLKQKGSLPLKLRDVWSSLPQGEHIHFLRENTTGALRMYQVCGKSFQETARLDYVQPILMNFATQYGERARLAADNEGVDWKAMSHALRAAYQVKELLLDGTMTFPRPEAALLYAVKLGNIDFKSVQEELERTMREVEILSERSLLPEEADPKFATYFIRYAYGFIGRDYAVLGI